MKFALSTAGLDLPPETIASTAKKHGFDGVEFDFPMSVPTAVPTAFEHGDVEVACLADGSSIDGQKNENQLRSKHVRSLIDLAGRVGCPLVRITESTIPRGQNRAACALALGDWLLPLADYAADRSVSLVLDNTQSLRTARETWAILDRLNHPSLGCCLDVLTLCRNGDSPQVVVPMLNSRITYVQISDVKDRAEPTVQCNLGEGIVPIKTTIARLRGIGYSGWMTVQWRPTSEAADARLSHAIQMLREWNKATQPTKAKAKAAH
jgi:sugar phosphate isomerase/epimerase